MSQFTTTNGNKQVVTTCQSGKFSSRLYVDNGNVATLVTAKHSTEKGARKWASKVLES